MYEQVVVAGAAYSGGGSWTCWIFSGASAADSHACAFQSGLPLGMPSEWGIGYDAPSINSPFAEHDAAAARMLRAAQNDTRLLIRVTVETLQRTGLRVGEYTGMRADAVVLIGAAPWLHVPVGKLHDDRYPPLHLNLIRLIDDYRAKYVPSDRQLLLPRQSGRPLDRHTVTRGINKAGAAAGAAAHPASTSCGTPWPPKRSTAACH